MHRMCLNAIVLFVLLCMLIPPASGREPFSWETPQAKVLPNGDLEWAPKPFRYEPGQSVRYIDFENGSDDRAGATPQTAWKHHPWDANATGSAAACRGADTYVFKGGVCYRGTLTVKEAGRPGNPIRLTRDANWGKGNAVLCGSERVTAWRRGADHKDIPEPDKVWVAELDFAPRSVWLVKSEDDIVRIPLARTPNWTWSNPDDPHAEWYVFDNPKKVFDNFVEAEKGRKYHFAIDTKHIKDKPESYFKGALIWPEFGWVMGTPYPTRVEVVDLEQHGLGFSGWTGGTPGSGKFHRHMRYYLEDKPHYLDDPAGEFWFEKKGKGGRLFIRLPADADPRRVRVEAGKRLNLVNGTRVKHLHVTGLTFRFTTPGWDITASSWDFSTAPWGFRDDMHPGGVRVWGEGTDIRVANCLFEHVVAPIRIRAIRKGQRVDAVRIEDNVIRYTEYGGIAVANGSAWGYASRHGLLGDVRIYRNRAFMTGLRARRFGNGTCIDVEYPDTAEIAGNFIERSGGQGINVRGAKNNLCWDDVPFTRILIHHNKVWQPMQIANDFGGIETWQGGPVYVFNNLVYDARGPQHWKIRHSGKGSGFGHAYYLDGSYKNYLFNNIAWGRSNDETSILVNCAAFQGIHGYQNTFFHNTAYNYVVGSRRQAPQAGRNKYLANVWQGMSRRVFRHADPAKSEAAANAADAGPQAGQFPLESNAYANNVFHDVKEIGVMEPSGRWHKTLESFRAVLVAHKSLATGVGAMATHAPLRDPAKGDFRPVPGSGVEGRGVKVFVPWALHGVVGEWPFLPAGDDPAHVMDEHWYFTDYHVTRNRYHTRPSYPLQGVHVGQGNYCRGELENWTDGALRFNAARKQYAVLTNEKMMTPFSFKGRKASPGEKGITNQEHTFEGEALKNPQIYAGNFLIEAYLKIEPGAAGLVTGKMKGAGYDLRIDGEGKAVFTVAAAAGSKASIKTGLALNDGTWHHLIAEADRTAKTLTLYVDGRQDAVGPGLGAVSLANEGDLCVAGTPTGDYLDATFDFLRIAQGTLADADTTIGELYAWQFDGPHLRDFAGRPRTAESPAGALAQ
ncbi:MAG: hypothetical protein JXR37_23160 [Kiritimatiellae bacterium]|nr:hypothetical protein [Kiritimatiellia bacterium]